MWQVKSKAAMSSVQDYFEVDPLSEPPRVCSSYHRESDKSEPLNQRIPCVGPLRLKNQNYFERNMIDLLEMQKYTYL